MAQNLRNHGVIEGRLTRDVAVFKNSDGSHKVRIRVAVDDNWTNKDGERGTQYIDLEQFVPASRGLGAFEHMGSGDHVGFAVHLESDNYPDKSTGETVYVQKAVIDGTDFKEPRSVTQARRQSKQAGAAGTAAGVATVGGGAQAPAQDPTQLAETPFSG